MDDQSRSASREWDAATYHRVSTPQFTWGQKVLAQLPLQGNETVLDAGCGTGRLTFELGALLPAGRVVGLDISQNMLREARDRVPVPLAGRAFFVAADLQDLPFTERFDGIFSTAAFHWVLDHDRLFGSLFGALRPGGWLCAQCGGGANLARLRGRAFALAATQPYAHALQDLRQRGNMLTPRRPGSGYNTPDSRISKRILRKHAFNSRTAASFANLWPP